jgi:ferredoxin
VGGGPSNPSGSDILAFELDNAYLFEGLSDKGRSALAAYSGLFRAPEAAEIAAKEQRAATAQSKVPRLNVDDPRKRLEGRFDAPFWDSVALRCLGCGTCTYLCPTCHCFDITDETEGETGRRIRTWDSCQYPLFTLHASGHNPRPARKQRMRQRILHKFSYSVDNFGETFCVGCGRCVRHCPVNLDLRETLESLMTLEG